MKLSLGFSPCPNDTFIFDALVNKKINTGGLDFDVVMADVETLNQWALVGKLDITKLSFGVLSKVLDQYIVLNSGSALGKAVGPLLISNKEIDHVEDYLIAIPGEHTTAHLLFSLAYPNAKNKVFLKYDEIEDFVVSGKGIGVIIHENRFTYESKGLNKILDLGDYWEKEMQSHIPLGGIVIKRSIDYKISLKVDQLIKQSIEYAYEHHSKIPSEFVINNAQEMRNEVMLKHIDLYVNEYSLDLGEDGKASISKLLNIQQTNNNANILQMNKIFLCPKANDK